MSVWFYNEKGQSKGPVTTQMIVSLWGRGVLKGEDLAYSQDRGEWKTLLEWDDIRKQHENEKGQNENDVFEQDIWILLQKNLSGVFVQNGPFDTSQIIEMLKKAQVKTSDYVWKQGLDQWDQIQNRKEFNLQNPILTQEQKNDLTLVEVMPLPNQGIGGHSEEAKVSFQVKNPERPIEKPQAEILSSAEKSKLQGSTLIIGMVLIMGGVLLYRGIRQNKEVMSDSSIGIEKSQISQNKQAPQIMQAPSPSISPVTEVAEAKKDLKPVVIQESATVMQPEKPKNRKFQMEMRGQSVVISLADSQHPVVNVYFEGQSGEVLDVPAYYRKISEKPNKSQEVVISMVQHQFPVGFYDVLVQTKQGSKIGSQKIFIGKDEKLYGQKINLHRKQISYIQQKEKRKILNTIEQAELRIGQILGQKKQISSLNFDAWWNKNFRNHLPPEIARAQSDKSELVYTPYWRKIGIQIDKMKVSIKQSTQQGRVPASYGLDAFKNQMGKIQKEVAKISHSRE